MARLPPAVCKGWFLGLECKETKHLMRTLWVVVRDIIADDLVKRCERVRVAVAEVLLLDEQCEEPNKSQCELALQPFVPASCL